MVQNRLGWSSVLSGNSSCGNKMKFQDLRPEDLQMLSLDENKLTVVLAGDRIETFTFRDRQEVEEAIRLWVQSRMPGKTGPRPGLTAEGEDLSLIHI